MTTLKSLVDETTNIKNEIVECHSNLSSILTSKNVEVLEEDKMSDLIGKVDLLGDAPPPPLYLYKDGDECVDITGGWEFKQSNGSSSTGTRQLEKREDCIYMKVVANSSTGHGADTTISLGIDVSEYNYLCFDCKIGHTDAYDRGYLLLINESGSSTIASYTLGKSKQLERQVIKLDISNIKQIGKARLSCSTVISGNWGENILYNCWLEV